MAKKKTDIQVTSCDDCPFLWENMEYPESVCKAAKRGWGMGVPAADKDHNSSDVVTILVDRSDRTCH